MDAGDLDKIKARVAQLFSAGKFWVVDQHGKRLALIDLDLGGGEDGEGIVLEIKT